MVVVVLLFSGPGWKIKCPERHRVLHTLSAESLLLHCDYCVLTCTVVYLKFIAVDAGNIRNLAMEKVAGSVLFPCRYVSNGCNATMPHTDKSSHEDGCEFR